MRRRASRAPDGSACLAPPSGPRCRADGGGTRVAPRARDRSADRRGGGGQRPRRARGRALRSAGAHLHVHERRQPRALPRLQSVAGSSRTKRPARGGRCALRRAIVCLRPRSVSSRSSRWPRKSSSRPLRRELPHGRSSPKRTKTFRLVPPSLRLESHDRRRRFLSATLERRRRALREAGLAARRRPNERRFHRPPCPARARQTPSDAAPRAASARSFVRSSIPGEGQ